MAKMKLSELRLPNQVQIGDVVARSGFAVGNQGVESIEADGPVVTVKRVAGKSDLVFSGSWYGTKAEAK